VVLKNGFITAVIGNKSSVCLNFKEERLFINLAGNNMNN